MSEVDVNNIQHLLSFRQYCTVYSQQSSSHYAQMYSEKQDIYL